MSGAAIPLATVVTTAPILLCIGKRDSSNLFEESKGVVRADSMSLGAMAMRGHRAPVVAVHATGDGRHLYSVSSDGVVCKWNTYTSNCAASWTGPCVRSVTCMCVSADDQYLFVGASDGQTFAPHERALMCWWMPTIPPGRPGAPVLHRPSSASGYDELDEERGFIPPSAPMAGSASAGKKRRPYVGEYVDISVHFRMGVTAIRYITVPERKLAGPPARPPSPVAVLDKAKVRIKHKRKDKAKAATKAKGKPRRGQTRKGTSGSAAEDRARRRKAKMRRVQLDSEAEVLDVSSVAAEFDSDIAAGVGGGEAYEPDEQQQSDTTGLSDEYHQGDDDDDDDDNDNDDNDDDDDTITECLIVGQGDGRLELVDVFRSTVRRVFDGHSMAIMSIAAGPTLAVSTSLDFAIRVWDVSSGELKQECHVSRRPVSMAVLFRFGTTMVERVSTIFIGGTDGVIEVISGVDLASRHLLYGHKPSMHIKALLPVAETGHLLSASADSSVRLWDLSSHTCVRTFAGHSESVNGLALNGASLFTASSDALVCEYDLYMPQHFVLEARTSFTRLSNTVVLLPILDLVSVTLQMLSFPLGSQIPWNSEGEQVRRTIEVGSMNVSFSMPLRLYLARFYLFVVLQIVFNYLFTFNVYESVVNQYGALAMRWAGANAAALNKRKKKYQGASDALWLFMWAMSTIAILPLVKAAVEVFKCSRDASGELRWFFQPSLTCYTGHHLFLTLLVSLTIVPYIVFATRLSVCSGDMMKLQSTADASIFKRLRDLLLTSWFREIKSDPYAGIFTKDPFAVRKYMLWTSLLKSVLSVLAIMLSDSALAMSLAFSLVALAFLVVQVIWRPYFFYRMNLVFFTCKAVVLYVCSVSVAVAIINTRRTFVGGSFALGSPLAVGLLVWLVGMVFKPQDDAVVHVEQLEKIIQAKRAAASVRSGQPQ